MDISELPEIKFPTHEESIIKVIGVGGGGSNAVNRMLKLGIYGVDFVVCNTDIQALRDSPVKNRIQLGEKLTEGLGAGSKPERGRAAALESMSYISGFLAKKTKMVFITAGMGGGTGTGAAPEIARTAKSMEILTVGVVTIPFSFEGKRKMQHAMDGINELRLHVDALLIIQNDRLRNIYGDLKLSECFAHADDVLAKAVKSIAEIIHHTAYVHVDFKDIEGVMRNSGVALMGTEEAAGEDRARVALEKALVSPLLNSHDIKGATNILVNILYGSDQVRAEELELIINMLKEKVEGNVDIIWGAGEDSSLGANLRVAVIAVGFNHGTHSFLEIQPQVELSSSSPLSASSPAVEIEEIPEELELVSLNASDLEAQAREKREEKKSHPRSAKPSSGNINKLPDVEGWFASLFRSGGDDMEM
ncbi:hypothetical protein FACS1894199_05440 [Bacteroidia bacterium]|nr:hypothetical protein FACS1894199_05440 [Bacteroidia bacterium]